MYHFHNTLEVLSYNFCVLTCRETIDGEVLPLVTVDQVSVTVEDTWDFDSSMNASTQAFGVFNMPIPTDIDPKGDYTVRRGSYTIHATDELHAC